MLAVQLAQRTPPNGLLLVFLLFPPFVLMPFNSAPHKPQCGMEFFPLL
jgi:hypothetical protein